MASPWSLQNQQVDPEELMRFLSMPDPNRQIASGEPMGPMPSPKVPQIATAHDMDRIRANLLTKGSGESLNLTKSQNSQTGSKVTANSYLEDQKLRQIMDMISQDPSMQALVQGQQANKDLMAAQIRATSSQVDLSPLAGFLRPEEAKIFLAAYQRPEGPQEMGQRALSSAMALQKEQSDIQKAKMDLFGRLKSGSTVDNQMSSFLEKLQAGAKDPNTGMRQVPDARKAQWLNNSAQHDLGPITKEFAEINKGIAMLEDPKRNSVSDFTFMDTFIKAMVGGRVTNYELARQRGSRALADRADQLAETLATGKLSKENRQQYLDTLRTMGQAHKIEMDLTAEQLRQLGNAFEMQPEVIDQLLSPRMRSITPPRVKSAEELKAEAPPEPKGISHMDRIAEELKKRDGK